jgi:signal transduction histidine kinase
LLSRVNRGDLRPHDLCLAAVARRIAGRLQDGEDRDVEFVIPDSLPARGDPELLESVLENLLGNAWKFTQRRARARIEVGMEPSDEGPRYFVRDDGAGFDQSYAHKLFGPFQRLHAENDFPGTGIGLATVQRIVHRHGGRIWAEGVPDEGATFRFTLQGASR